MVPTRRFLLVKKFVSVTNYIYIVYIYIVYIYIDVVGVSIMYFRMLISLGYV